jgi:hypothetical protein
MAIKLGAENKRNVIIAGVLFCVLAYLAISQLFSGPSTPPAAPAATVVTPPPLRTPPVPARTTGSASARAGWTAIAAPVRGVAGPAGPVARQVPGTGLDPSLHLERLATSESIEYAGSGRNIFSADSAPVNIETPVTTARNNQPVWPVEPPPYVAPQPPQIELKYFGFSAAKDGKREAFLLHGDDIFEAASGEIVNRRYKIVSVDAHSVQVTDLSYNNTQTLQLTAN